MRSALHPASGLLLAVMLLLLAGCDKHAEDKAAVRQTWDLLFAAYEASDAHTAAELTTAGSFDYYERIRRAVVSGTQEEISRMTLMERSLVITARHRSSSAALAGLDGRGFLKHVVASGWWSFGEPNWIRFGEIVVNGDNASARVIADGTKTSHWFYFIREDPTGQPSATGVWKLDDRACDQFWNAWAANAAREEGMPEDAYIMLLEELDSGDAIRPDILSKPTE